MSTLCESSVLDLVLWDDGEAIEAHACPEAAVVEVLGVALCPGCAHLLQACLALGARPRRHVEADRRTA